MYWDAWAAQHEATGNPGLRYERLTHPWHKGDIFIECLLLYDGDGLAGLIHFYPNGDAMDGVAVGSMHIAVRPDKRRTGIGKLLLTEARKRWTFDISDTGQIYTAEGLALSRAARAEGI